MELSEDQREDVEVWLSGWRRPMLECLRFYQGSDNMVKPKDIRDYSGVSIGSFHNHIDQLMDPPDRLGIQPLVKIAERRQLQEGGPPTRIFELTEEGEDLFEGNMIDDVGFSKEDFESLHQRVDRAEDLVEDIDDSVDETRGLMRDKLGQQSEEISSVQEQLSDLDSRLQSVESTLDDFRVVVTEIRKNEEYLPDP